VVADKHLVLDEDVHRKLKQRKKETGLTVREIGNSVLRSVLWRHSLSDLIGKRLVDSGAISAEEYTRIREEAVREATIKLHNTKAAIKVSKRGTIVTGSWEVREISCSSDGLYHVLEGWARDGRGRPMPPHNHEGDEYFIVLKGRISASIEEREMELVKAPGCLRVPAGAIHSVAPLTRDTRLITVLSPPEPAYLVGE